MDKRMDEWKEEYRAIKAPGELEGGIEDAARRAREEKRRAGRRRAFKWAAEIAAAAAVVLILPNASQAAAAAMQQIPVLGPLFKVVTVREYRLEEAGQSADVKVPSIQVEGEAAEAPRPEPRLEEFPESESQAVLMDGADADESGAPRQEESSGTESQAAQAARSAAEINIDIQEITDQMVEEFKEAMEESGGEGYQNLQIDSETLVDDDDYFTLELTIYQGAGSGAESHRHYTIDKATGERARLSDFYGDGYVDIVSDEVKRQMREQMEADEEVIYWLDDETVGEWNFTSIREDQDFYVNADGDVVVCFDEYEVAPGYMGCVEFVMDPRLRDDAS